MTKSEMIYQKGVDLVEEDLNLIALVQAVQRMKATLSVMLQVWPLDRDKLIENARFFYLKKQTLSLDALDDDEP